MNNYNIIDICMLSLFTIMIILKMYCIFTMLSKKFELDL